MWQEGGIAKTFKNQRKINDFGRFHRPGDHQKACKVAVRRSCCGLEGSKTATWMANWLQDRLGRAKLSPKWPKLAPRWPQEGSKKYLAGFSRWSPPLFGPILDPSWAISGPPWAFLGGPRGPLEAYRELRRAVVSMICGKKVGLQKQSKT